ncbi:MAG: hypothetical protein V3U49_01325 [Nitrososphaerales archaeon]
MVQKQVEYEGAAQNEIEEVFEKLQSHFEDIAWFIGKYDEVKDPYGRLDWVRKMLGRMHPDEVETLFKNLDDKMMRCATLASCIQRAYSPIWSGYDDYEKPLQREQPNTLIMSLPGWVRSQLPPRLRGQRRSDYESMVDVERVMGDFFKFSTPTDHPDYQYTFQISSHCYGPRYDDLETFRQCANSYWSDNAITFSRHAYERLKTEFEYKLGTILDGIVSRIRIEYLEPKGITIKHARSAKEEKKEG